MIHAILIFNNYGKPRLSKFYQHFVSKNCRFYSETFFNYLTYLIFPQTEQQQQTIITETFQLISKREDMCNFLELPSSFLMNAASDCKLIYRHYATLWVLCSMTWTFINNNQNCAGTLCSVAMKVKASLEFSTWSKFSSKRSIVHSQMFVSSI